MGNRIKKMLDTLGWDQKTLSNVSGVPTSSISRYIKTGQITSAKNLVAIARALGVSVDWLLRGNQ